MSITVPEKPQVALSFTREDLADLIDAAAQLLDEVGLWHGDLWPVGPPLVGEDWPYDVDFDVDYGYIDGRSCCTAGALAVACGYRHIRHVEDDFFGFRLLGYDPTLGYPDTVGPHPALAALLAQLRCTELEQLFAWSDDARTDQVVARLREAAAAVRAGRLS